MIVAGLGRFSRLTNGNIVEFYGIAGISLPSFLQKPATPGKEQPFGKNETVYYFHARGDTAYAVLATMWRRMWS